MPTLNESNVRHLLRRTEIVDRPDRVTHLLSLATIEDAVDDVMNVPANPPSASFAGVPADSNWQKGVRLAEHWMDQMATVERSFGERMAFFWHGHICSELGKVSLGRGRSASRSTSSAAVASGRQPTGAMSPTSSRPCRSQVAMLATSTTTRTSPTRRTRTRPRADGTVPARCGQLHRGRRRSRHRRVDRPHPSTLGHRRVRVRCRPPTTTTPQIFLGRTINAGAPQRGRQRHDRRHPRSSARRVVGTIPQGAEKNSGRPSDEVAAEFLTFKLLAGVRRGRESRRARRRRLCNDLGAARQQLRHPAMGPAMLTHDDFYAESTRSGSSASPSTSWSH